MIDALGPPKTEVLCKQGMAQSRTLHCAWSDGGGVLVSGVCAPDTPAHSLSSGFTHLHHHLAYILLCLQAFCLVCFQPSPDSTWALAAPKRPPWICLSWGFGTDSKSKSPPQVAWTCPWMLSITFTTLFPNTALIFHVPIVLAEQRSPLEWSETSWSPRWVTTSLQGREGGLKNHRNTLPTERWKLQPPTGFSCHQQPT